MMDYLKAYGLPERYFLSLGRMVEKKNLATLVSAYARYVEGVAGDGRSQMETGNLNRSGAEIAEGKPELSETADGEKQGAWSVEHGVGSMEQRANLTENCKLKTEHCPPGLVFVGSGELEDALREQARSLGLRVVDRTDWKVNGREKAQEGDAGNRENGRPARLHSDVTGETPVPPGQAVDRTDAGPKTKRLRDEETEGLKRQAEPRLCETGLSQNCELNTENSVENDRGAVYFYGFRQIEENPVFYALAEAFVLPSLKEEWGLVVNEAMACSLPVIVSRTAGCAEDLLPGSESWQCSVGSVQSGEDAGSLNPQRSTLNSLEERSNGFVFDPSSVDALSEALRRIADPLNPQLSTLNAAAMGRRSREIVAQFSCENFARQAMRAACAARGGGCESYR